MLPSRSRFFALYYFFCAFHVVLTASLPWTKLSVEKAGTRLIYRRESSASADTSEALISLVGAEALANTHKDSSSNREIEVLFIKTDFFASPVTAPPVSNSSNSKKKNGKKGPAPTSAPVADSLNSDRVQNTLNSLYEDFTAAHFVKNLAGFINLYCNRLYSQTIEGYNLESPYFNDIKAFKLSFLNGKVTVYSYFILDEASDPDLINRMHFGTQLSSLFPSSVPALLEQSAAGWQAIIETLKNANGGANVSSLLSKNTAVTSQPSVTLSSNSKKSSGKKAVSTENSVLTPEDANLNAARLIAEFEKENELKLKAEQRAKALEEERKRKIEADMENARIEREFKAKKEKEDRERERKLQSERDKKAREEKIAAKNAEAELKLKKAQEALKLAEEENARKLAEEARKKAAEEQERIIENARKAADLKAIQDKKLADEAKAADAKRRQDERDEKNRIAELKRQQGIENRKAAAALKKQQEEEAKIAAALKKQQEEEAKIAAALKKQQEEETLKAALKKQQEEETILKQKQEEDAIELERARHLAAVEQERFRQLEAENARAKAVELENTMLRAEIERLRRQNYQIGGSFHSSPENLVRSSASSISSFEASPYNGQQQNAIGSSRSTINPPGLVHGSPYVPNENIIDSWVTSNSRPLGSASLLGSQYPNQQYVQQGMRMPEIIPLAPLTVRTEDLLSFNPTIGPIGSSRSVNSLNSYSSSQYGGSTSFIDNSFSPNHLVSPSITTTFPGLFGSNTALLNDFNLSPISELRNEAPQTAFGFGLGTASQSFDHTQLNQNAAPSLHGAIGSGRNRPVVIGSNTVENTLIDEKKPSSNLWNTWRK